MVKTYGFSFDIFHPTPLFRNDIYCKIFFFYHIAQLYRKSRLMCLWGLGHFEFLLVFASFFHCQELKYFALHRFALYSLSRVFVEGQVLRGIPCACLEATDRWEALNLTVQTQGRAEDWAWVLWVDSRCHWRILSIRFSDIATETCSLTLPAVFFFFFVKTRSKPRNSDQRQFTDLSRML